MRVIPAILLVIAVVAGGLTVVGDGDELDAGEEIRFGTAPFLPDTDFDGLDDGAEQRLGTNPIAPDTDGDGLPDGVEASEDGPVSAGDPLRKDVFVEVDTVRGNDSFTDPEVREKELGEIKQALADGAIENPDGTTGMDLHIVYDETMTRGDGSVIKNEYWELRQNHHDMKGYGYYYVVVVEDVERSADEDGLNGYAWSGAGGFVEDHGYNTGETFMHELGHAFGLLPETYKGIDSRDVEPTEYRSVMNYDYPCDDCEQYRFSSAESSFNDWAYLEDNYQPPQTNNLGDPLSELFSPLR